MEKGLKPVLGAALVGGCICVLGELLFMAFGALGVGAASPMALVVLVLLVMGLVGGVLFLTGAQSKLEKFGSVGAMLPFTGFTAGMAGMTYGARIAGARIGGAMKACWKGFFQLLWWPILVSLAAGAAAFFFAR